MRACPSCGHENPPDVDFCTNCGQYIRWEPTRLATAVPAAPEASVAPPEAPPAAPPPAPDVPPDSILLALRVPGLELPPEAELQTDVAPGGTAIVMALIRNQSGIVDNYDIAVEGMPESWWSVSPPT